MQEIYKKGVGMKLKFLGTSAGEQYPGIWCECANCSKARDLGGKNIRRNSCLCIDDEILLDLPYEIASQSREFNVKLTAINSLLLTHSHKDHFHPYILLWRQRDERASLDVQKYGLEFSVLPEMNVFGNAEVCRLIKEELGGDLDKYFLILYEARPFEEFKIGNKKVMPVPANHSTGKDECPLNYIVSDGDATFFYGLDSGWFLPESYEVIKKYKYDAVVVEGGKAFPG
jgi:phosphoribosyl 1,2-cyclic phosphate phosphodiesterase